MIFVFNFIYMVNYTLIYMLNMNKVLNHRRTDRMRWHFCLFLFVPGKESREVMSQSQGSQNLGFRGGEESRTNTIDIGPWMDSSLWYSIHLNHEACCELWGRSWVSIFSTKKQRSEYLSDELHVSVKWKNCVAVNIAVLNNKNSYYYDNYFI